ncbi:hypothetical protein Nocox_25675 [Nonomuraea coxensis DSM 45129]|uniref:Lipoprotein n=1 Tax=Nonomuraea coxensis DSM 45129 TaxID=1122611 RepID=A0ABX8U741_9ACTN|nr:hypothetical protein [Nonomuraea coxensis]QYC42736.1 hypothetical protein Nocox_25675 [Nonomuraea coxensis DSM 45129]
MTPHTTARAALAATLAAGLLLAGTAPAAQAATAKGTFGPHGYGGVRLGMSAKAAKATGKIRYKRAFDSTTCTGWELKAHPAGKDAVGLYISKKRGVAMIFAPKGARTPAGIGVGATLTSLKKAYPGLRTAASGYPYAKVPGNPKAYYAFLVNAKNRVYEIALALNTQDCAN